MSTTLVSTLSLFLLACTQYAEASWRVNANTLFSGRMDSLIAPGKVSAHVHDVTGGNNFKSVYDYDDLRRSSCSSVEVQDDKSNYWAPAVYYRHRDGTFELVDSGYAIYYLHRGSETNIQQFPAGLTMIAGSPFKNTWQGTPEDKAVNYNCLDYKGGPHPETNEFPKRHCPDGIRVQVLFPSCWNGKDVTSANHKTHVSYPQGTHEGGTCPPSHPIRFMTLFYEHFIHSGKYEYYDGAFVFAHGDTVGWGSHGDFQNGWDASPNSVLQQAINNCHDNFARLDQCAVLMASVNTEAAKTCRPQTYLPLEDIGIYGGLRNLPGDNSPWGGSVPRTSRGAVPNPPWASAYTTLSGWKDRGCIDEGNIYTNSMLGDKLVDDNMYPGLCIKHCESKGFSMAGLEAGKECYCANQFSNGGNYNLVGAGRCDHVCPGSLYEFCGGQRKINLYLKTGDGGVDDNSYPPAGSRLTQVYYDDGTSAPTLPGSGDGGYNSPPPSTNPPPTTPQDPTTPVSPSPNPGNGSPKPPVCKGKLVRRNLGKRSLQVRAAAAEVGPPSHIPLHHRRFAGRGHH